MSLKRRQFLLLSGFSAISAGFLGYKSHQIPKIASNPVIAANTNQKDLLLRFVSIADTGTGTRSQYAVAQAMTNYHRQNPYDLVVMAGDNIYPDGEIEKIAAVFERPYANLLKAGVKFQGALGNHDIRTDNGDRQYLFSTGITQKIDEVRDVQTISHELEKAKKINSLYMGYMGEIEALL